MSPAVGATVITATGAATRAIAVAAERTESRDGGARRRSGPGPAGPQGERARAQATGLARLALRATAALLLMLGAGFVNAQQQSTEPDHPARVGRLALIAGDVLSWNAREASWEEALVNLPVTSASAFATGHGARAEVQVGDTILRMDGSTQVNFEQLDDAASVVRLEHGNVVLRLPDADAERTAEPAWTVIVRTLELRFVAPGAYRLEYDRASGRLGVAVTQGQVRVDGGIASMVLDRDLTRLDVIDGRPLGQTPIPRTVFSAWSDLRDREAAVAETYRHVSPEMTGAQDLDRWGDWQDDAEYGPIWFPRVAAGWVPYRDGHWVWVAPWGWSWVDAAPWGFAPFHYGRWVVIRGAWAWVPGRYVRRPVYAPALVGFYGSDGGIGVSLTFAAGAGIHWGLTVGNAPVAGWFPLAPGEVWRPPYRASHRYLRNVNVTHVTNVVVIDRDRHRAVERYRYAHDRRFSTLATRTAVLRSRRLGDRHLQPDRPLRPFPEWRPDAERPGRRDDRDQQPRRDDDRRRRASEQPELAPSVAPGPRPDARRQPPPRRDARPELPPRRDARPELPPRRDARPELPPRRDARPE
ncbi:MAG: hypothetical protein JSW68_07870, partial [Burkholderiales bacterium]